MEKSELPIPTTWPTIFLTLDVSQNVPRHSVSSSICLILRYTSYLVICFLFSDVLLRAKLLISIFTTD